MPRVSSAVRVGVPMARSFQRARTVVANVPGRPTEPAFQQTFPVVIKPSYKMAGIRRLQKVDVSKGITMPEANKLPFVAGVVAPGNASYGPSRILLQRPYVGRTIGGNTQRIIAAPSPTNNAGVRSPYNQKVKVGKRGSTTRYGGAQGPSGLRYSTGTKRR